MCLAESQNAEWGSNPGPLDMENHALLPGHCAPLYGSEAYDGYLAT